MKEYKILFCDLDGTLIKTKTQSTFPKGVWDMEIRFDVLDAIKLLNPKYILIVSNQGGISKGFVNEENFINKMEYLVSAISEYTGVKNVYYEYCSNNDKNNQRRKPNTLMLDSLMLKVGGFIHKSDDHKSKTLMIGDASGLPGQFSDSDKKTAENFNIDYMDVETFISGKKNLKHSQKVVSYNQEVEKYKNILEKYMYYLHQLKYLEGETYFGDAESSFHEDKMEQTLYLINTYKDQLMDIEEKIHEMKKEIKTAQREYAKGLNYRMIPK